MNEAFANPQKESPLMQQEERLKNGVVDVVNPYTKRICDVILLPVFLLGAVLSSVFDNAIPMLIAWGYFAFAMFGGALISAFAKQEDGVTKIFPFDEIWVSQGILHFANNRDRFELSWNPLPGGRMSNKLKVVAGPKNQFEFRFYWYQNKLLRALCLCPGLVGHEVLQITKEMYRPELRMLMSDEEYSKLFSEKSGHK
jgi:hypothetical protein